MFSLPPVSPLNLSAPYTPHTSSPLANSSSRTAPSSIKNATKRGPVGYHVNQNLIPSFQTSHLASSPTEHFRETQCSQTSNRKRNRSTAAFSSRQTKPNPLISARRGTLMRAESRETRRNLFFKKIKEATDEKRWRERKGGFCEGDEEIMRALWLADKRHWKEQREKEASSWKYFKGFEEDEQGTEADRSKSDVDITPPEEIDEDLPEERLLLDDTQENHQGTILAPRFDPADDDIYDDIFMDLIKEEDKASYGLMWKPKGGEDPNEMDLS